MTLRDAIKSGKRFRRKDWKYWLSVSPRSSTFVWEHGAEATLDVRPEWVVATDWEIEDTYYPISDTELSWLDSKNFGLHTPEGYFTGNDIVERITARKPLDGDFSK